MYGLGTKRRKAKCRRTERQKTQSQIPKRRKAQNVERANVENGKFST